MGNMASQCNGFCLASPGGWVVTVIIGIAILALIVFLCFAGLKAITGPPRENRVWILICGITTITAAVGLGIAAIMPFIPAVNVNIVAPPKTSQDVPSPMGGNPQQQQSPSAEAYEFTG